MPPVGSQPRSVRIVFYLHRGSSFRIIVIILNTRNVGRGPRRTLLRSHRSPKLSIVCGAGSLLFFGNCLTLPITCRRPIGTAQVYSDPQAGGGQVERKVRLRSS